MGFLMSEGKVRRRAMLAAVGAVAAAGGAGLAWWRLSPKPEADGAVADFWSLQFATPDGGVMAMTALQGRPVLLNFWATWCPPCVEELPLLDAFYKENLATGWQVLGIAVDQLASVQSFLARQPLSFPVVLAGSGGASLSKSFGNLTGSLPFSVLLGADGSVRGRKIGKLSMQDLALWRTLK
jgi:thiol-disulfide isomerase/thioredoxin